MSSTVQLVNNTISFLDINWRTFRKTGSIDWDNVQILASDRFKDKLMVKESVFIRNTSSVINRSLGMPISNSWNCFFFGKDIVFDLPDP